VAQNGFIIWHYVKLKGKNCYHVVQLFFYSEKDQKKTRPSHHKYHIVCSQLSPANPRPHVNTFSRSYQKDQSTNPSIYRYRINKSHPFHSVPFHICNNPIPSTTPPGRGA
jgi:hypothetical protein